MNARPQLDLFPGTARPAKPPKLAPPSMADRAVAARAARALRAAQADPSSRGEKSVIHIDLSRPRRGVWVTTFQNLPGYSIENGAHMHALLPGWQYTEDEVWFEMIPDLEVLAERGVLPTEATS